MTIIIFTETENITPVLRYLARELGYWLNVTVELTGDSNKLYHLVYGEQRQASDLVIPRIRSYSEKNIPLAEDFLEDTYLREQLFPFDLFAALRFWLLDEAHKSTLNYAIDVHQRLIPMHSVQGRLNTIDRPPVNRYLISFRRWLEARTGRTFKQYLPKGKRAAIILSHDVDMTDKNIFSYKTFLLRHQFRQRSPYGFLKASASAIKAFLSNVLSSEDYWLFEKVMDAEERLGVHSTFFFAAFTNFNQRLGPNNVKYLISNERFRKLFEEMKDRGFEIGLHPSYETYNDNRLLKQEKQRLDEQAGIECQCVRHHAWHIGHPPWTAFENQASVGFKYDSSIVFNDEPGYRFGVALPFHPWMEKQLYDLIEIPAGIMDGAFFYQEEMTIDRALIILSSIIDSLKVHEGVMAIDWHNYTSFPGNKAYHVWGAAYIELLNYLTHDHELFVGSFEEFLRISTATVTSFR